MSPNTTFRPLDISASRRRARKCSTGTFASSRNSRRLNRRHATKPTMWNCLEDYKLLSRRDLSQMRNMTLDKGFQRLFNGKDFTGWGFVVGPNCQPGPEGCAATSPGTTFKVKE